MSITYQEHRFGVIRNHRSQIWSDCTGFVLSPHSRQASAAARMSFLENVARIRAELIGAASDMSAASVVAAALPLMGIVPDRLRVTVFLRFTKISNW